MITGARICWQNISLLNPHSFTAPDLLCRGSLPLCFFSVTVVGGQERREGSEAGGEINQKWKPQKSNSLFFCASFPVSS